MRPRGIPDDVKPIDYPVTYVIQEEVGDVHVFFPAHFQLELVRIMAQNLR